MLNKTLYPNTLVTSLTGFALDKKVISQIKTVLVWSKAEDTKYELLLHHLWNTFDWTSHNEGKLIFDIKYEFIISFSVVNKVYIFSQV